MLRALGIVHPLPSLLNALAVAGLALIASASSVVALTLATGMFGFQASIGALNDLVDAERDATAKPAKPIPSGRVSPRAALVLAAVGGAAGLIVSASFGMPVLVLGAAGYATGLAYDLVMRRVGWGWLCYALALPLLLLWVWVAVTGDPPPGWPLLLPLAALTGPALHLANSLVDLEGDRSVRSLSLATRLGPDRARTVLAALTFVVFALAWLALLAIARPPMSALLAAVAGTIGGGIGVGLMAHRDERLREVGWILQASAYAVLAIAWAASMIER